MTEKPTLLVAEDVVAGYLPGVDILTGVSVHVDDGEIVTVVGPNGAGKSTLLKTIFGFVRPHRGRVSLRGKDVTGEKPHFITRRGVAYVPQLENVFATMSVEENLEMGGISFGKGQLRSRVAAIYDLLPILGERRRQMAATLSGGERQLLAMARALIPEPGILLLDEPSAGLAPGLVDLIFEKVEEINRTGVAVLIVEQNARRSLAISDRGYVLDLGRNRFEGRGPTLLEDPTVAELYLGGGRSDGEDEVGR